MIDRGSRKQLQARLRELRKSTRGGKVSGQGGIKYAVEYSVRPAVETGPRCAACNFFKVTSDGENYDPVCVCGHRAPT